MDPEIFKTRTMESQSANVKQPEVNSIEPKGLNNQPTTKQQHPATVSHSKTVHSSPSKPKLPGSSSRSSLAKDANRTRTTDLGTTLADSLGNRRDSEVPEGKRSNTLRGHDNLSSAKTIESQFVDPNDSKAFVKQPTPFSMAKPKVKKSTAIVTNVKDSSKQVKGGLAQKSAGLKK